MTEEHLEPPTPSLREATLIMRESLRNQIGTTLDDFDAIASDLGEREFAAPKPGEEAPDFTLPDARGVDRTLSDLLADGEVVLTFYRGAWCPYCNLQLRDFQRALPQIRGAGAELVAISPQAPDQSLTTTEINELEFAVLSDVGSVVAERYGLVFSLDEAAQDVHRSVGIDLGEVNEDETWRLPAAASFVISRDGRVAFADVSADYRWRPASGDLLEVLRSGPR